MLKEQEINRIIYLYTQNNLSIVQISKQTGHTQNQVSKILKDHGILIKLGLRKWEPDEETLKIIKFEIEDNHNSYKQVAKMVGKDSSLIRRVCKEHNFQYNYIPLNKNMNHNYFSKIDSLEKAWLLGMLWTDGSVRQIGGTYQIRISLQRQDEYVMDFIKEQIGLENKILKDNRPGKECSGLEFSSQQIFNDLSKYGIVPNKTYITHSLHLELIPDEFKKAYVLGLLDGDGTLTYNFDSMDYRVAFTSKNIEPVQEMQLFIDDLIQKPAHNKIHEHNDEKYSCSWHGRLLVLSILDQLYADMPFYLQRKYKKYLEIKQSIMI